MRGHTGLATGIEYLFLMKTLSGKSSSKELEKNEMHVNYLAMIARRRSSVKSSVAANFIYYSQHFFSFYISSCFRCSDRDMNTIENI